MNPIAPWSASSVPAGSVPRDDVVAIHAVLLQAGNDMVVRADEHEAYGEASEKFFAAAQEVRAVSLTLMAADSRCSRRSRWR